MTSAKYIGMDLHKETISIAVMNSAGKLHATHTVCQRTHFARMVCVHFLGKGGWSLPCFFAFQSRVHHL